MARSKKKSPSQRKYVLDILVVTGLLGCRFMDTPMETNVKLLSEQEEDLNNLVDIED